MEHERRTGPSHSQLSCRDLRFLEDRLWHRSTVVLRESWELYKQRLFSGTRAEERTGDHLRRVQTTDGDLPSTPLLQGPPRLKGQPVALVYRRTA